MLSRAQGGEAPRDRTLRNAFTHDHFDPSTHRQTALYARLIIEPKGSNWFHNETGQKLCRGTANDAPRPDGGPTSRQAFIFTEDPVDSYR